MDATKTDDDKIVIQLNRVIIAHHYGYRIVARTPGITDEMLHLLESSPYHTYYYNRSLEQRHTPVKYRYFRLDSHYVLGRCASSRDVTTNRMWVSDGQFFVIDDSETFENGLGANAPYLMAQLRFARLNLAQLGRGQVIDIPPVNITIPVNDSSRPGMILRELLTPHAWQALFDERVMNALDSGKTLYIHGYQFKEPIDIFNSLCRGFYDMLPDTYRRLSFSTGEFVPTKGYKVVFLHGIEPIQAHEEDVGLFISIDSSLPQGSRLWYIDGEFSEQLRKHVSKRLNHRNAHAIKILEAYCGWLMPVGECQDQEAAAGGIKEILWGMERNLQYFACPVIVEDVLEFLRISGDAIDPVGMYLNLFSFLVKVAAQAEEQLPSSTTSALLDSMCHCFERLTVKNSTNKTSNIETAINSLGYFSMQHQAALVHYMIDQRRGLASEMTYSRKENRQPFLKAWYRFTSVCHEMISQEAVAGSIWKVIISFLDKSEWKEGDRFERLHDLLLYLCELAAEENREVLQYDMMDVLWGRRLHQTFIVFVGATIKKYSHGIARIERLLNYLRSHFYQNAEIAHLLDFASCVPGLFKEQTFDVARLLVRDLVHVSMERKELRGPIISDFIFNGKYSLGDPVGHYLLLTSVKQGIQQYEITKKVQDRGKHPYQLVLAVQEELLVNLGLIPKEILAGRHPATIGQGYEIRLRSPSFSVYISISDTNVSSFFTNLFGFKHYGQLKGMLLPVFWSYAQEMPGNWYCDEIFSNFSDYIDRVLPDGAKAKAVNKALLEESSMLSWIPRLGTKKAAPYDHENILYQLAVATLNRRSNIIKLVQVLNRKYVKSMKGVVDVLKKYYVGNLEDTRAIGEWEKSFASVLPLRENMQKR